MEHFYQNLPDITGAFW